MIVIRRVTLSPGADELLKELAGQAKIEPDVFGSLVLENAIRERHEIERRFADAARRVDNAAAVAARAREVLNAD